MELETMIQSAEHSIYREMYITETVIGAGALFSGTFQQLMNWREEIEDAWMAYLYYHRN